MMSDAMNQREGQGAGSGSAGEDQAVAARAAEEEKSTGLPVFRRWGMVYGFVLLVFVSYVILLTWLTVWFGGSIL